MDQSEIKGLIRLRDEQQKAIIENGDTPQLANAGPGTGKSYCFAERLKFLRKLGANTDNTLVLSFTNACVKMLQDDLIEKGVGEFVVYTVHKIAKIIIHENTGNSAITLKNNFLVAFEHDSEEILRDAAEDLKLKLNGAGNTAKAFIYSPLANLTKYSFEDSKSKELLERYNSLRSFYNCANFYELTHEALKLLSIDKIRQKYLKKWKFILVDEYQDLNRADQELIRLLTNEGKWLTLAGDDNQSIYGSMRFAYPKGMREIKSLYPDIQIRRLEVSNRCTQNIMHGAIAIANLQKDQDTSLNKNLSSLKEEGQKIVIAPLSISNPNKGRNDEADWICQRVQQALNTLCDEKAKVLILGPNKKFLNNIYQRMQQMKISNCELQKPDPLDKVNQENLNLFWHLRLLLNKNDNLAFRRILGITKGSNMSVIRRKAEEKGTFWDLSDEPEVTKVKNTIDKIKQIITASESLDAAIKKISKLLQHSDKEQLDTFLKNFRGSKGLKELIDILSLELTEQPPLSKTEEKKIRLMTFHSSKGLGEHIVFLAGLEEGFLPKHNNDFSDEEVRLFYVALTRAKSNVFISHVWRRYDGTTYDKGGARKQSCFVSKIPEKYKETLTAATPSLSQAGKIRLNYTL